ncbi:MAG: sulfotransferase, partial [Odoribacter sp.]|nr:sulfotransferase [Odoribacter sp.]
MGLIEFQKLPINTLVGADWKTFKAITKGQNVEKKYKGKYRLTKFVCRILSSVNPIEQRRYNKRIKDLQFENDPVFILGHWRSGTTFVHNILALDKHFGFTTTYQTVFPNLVLWRQPLFKKTMAWLMPDKRPTDNMELNVDLPQEEEFALSNMMPYTYYNYWYFPQNMIEYCDKYLTFEKATEEEVNTFKDTFLKMVKVSLWNTKGTQFLSKNPPHTSRIKEILEVFPNAKFIYLMRNPYTVFESTRSFFTNTIKPLKLQDISDEEMEYNIIEIYKKLYAKYEKDKDLIPEGNLIEIKFEDFEKDALGMTKKIYETLNIPGFKEA